MVTDKIMDACTMFVPADDEGYKYTGRIDNGDPKAPVIIWQGTTINAWFTGRILGIKFANPWGPNFFNVIIDGKISVLKIQETGVHVYSPDEELAPGDHELVVFKRTEAMFGHVAFEGIYIERDAGFGPPPERRGLIEFYGDSITAGACNEDPGADQYDDYSTHNNYMSYGAIAARALGFDYGNISVSGSGICCSWNPILMPDIYDKLYPDAKSVVCDFSGRKTDIVVINLGQNDFGFPESIGKPFPPDFVPRYVLFVKNIRRMYPSCEIVCAIGGLTALGKSPDLRQAFYESVCELASADKRINSYVFDAYSETHPRVETHIAMANELVDFLKTEFPVLTGRFC